LSMREMHAPTKVVPGRRKCLQAKLRTLFSVTMSDLQIKLHILDGKVVFKVLRY